MFQLEYKIVKNVLNIYGRKQNRKNLNKLKDL